MTETSIEIIAMLRESRLGWIADELAEAIALGEQTVKDYREPGAKRKSKGTTITPFSESQEIELIVETLLQYFILIPQSWSKARSRFARRDMFGMVNLNEKYGYPHNSGAGDDREYSVTLGIADENKDSFQEFGREYLTHTLPKLRHVLSRLWPQGPEDFTSRFSVEAQER